VTRLLAPAIDERIRVRLDLAAEAPWVKGDPGQIEQVILNLALNARDAMPEGGELRIATELVRLEPSGSTGTELHRGPYVVMTVSDSGTGIAAEHLDRIFEPFFTTKSPGEGSGMGLATAYGIVKNHGGTIEVESRPGHGTTFRIYLPQRRGETPVPTRDDDAPARARTGATILVIDDEEPILRGVSRVLRGLGYTVETAKSALRAIAWFEEHAAEVDLVILDLVMPRLGGKACFERLRSIRPDVHVLLSTGHGRDGAAQEILDAGAVGFLPKPYNRRQLAHAVARALASDPA
jgi:CheY-like chemotaxis protein